jgi:phosphoglycerate dehydrogenase-like enzyme
VRTLTERPVIAIFSPMKHESDSPGWRLLRSLHDREVVEIADPFATEKPDAVPQILRGRCDALLCRPLWTYETSVVNDVIDVIRRKGSPRPFVIGTLSAGRAHVKTARDDERIQVIASDGGNADQTAELTVYMAISLKRRVHPHVLRMAIGGAKREESVSCTSLRDQTWTIMGRGNVAQAVVRRAMALGLRRIVMWNHQMSRGLLAEAMSEISTITWLSNSNLKPCAVIGASDSGPACVIEGTIDLNYALREGDVISVHVTLADETRSLISGGTGKHPLNGVKPGAVLINMARAEIVDEEHVLEMLASGKLAGFATDVLPGDVEGQQGRTRHKPSESLVWSAYCWLCMSAMDAVNVEGTSLAHVKDYRAMICGTKRGQRNEFREELFERLARSGGSLLVLPHLGGWTRDAEADIEVEVIGKVLEALDLPAEARKIYSGSSAKGSRPS